MSSTEIALDKSNSAPSVTTTEGAFPAEVFAVSRKWSLLLTALPKVGSVQTVAVERLSGDLDGLVRHMTVSVPGKNGYMLVASICESSVRALSDVSWIIDDEIIRSVSTDPTARKDFCEVVRQLVVTPQRAGGFIRQLCEGLFVYLKVREDDEARAFFERAQRSVAGPSSAPVVTVYPIGDYGVVLECSILSQLAPIETIHWLGEERLRRFMSVPYIDASKGVAYILIEIGLERLLSGSLFLWTQSNVVELGFNKTQRADLPRLMDTVLNRQLERGRFFCWLREALSPLSNFDARIATLLREIEPRDPKKVRQTAQITDRLRIDIWAALRARTGKMVVFGSVEDPEQLLKEIDWVGPGGRLTSLMSHIQWCEHKLKPTQDKPNRLNRRSFVATLATPQTMAPLSYERFIATTQTGRRHVLSCRSGAADAEQARDALLSSIPARTSAYKLFEAGYGDAIDAFHTDTIAGERVRTVQTIGVQSSHPDISLVVPIYKNLDFLRQQFAAFAFDRFTAKQQIIYVVDDPDSADKVEAILRPLSELYGLGCTLIIHRKNYGYAPAVNTGAYQATGRSLLLLNSDVLPITPQWLVRMHRELWRDEAIGVVGPKLLFSNNTIQHAGLGFETDPYGWLFNRSLFKGYHRDYRPANRRGEVKALTGACLLLRKSLWDSLGGLDEGYVIGDFEDTDLCLRIGRAGWRCRYLPSAELYHFERQSIDAHPLHSGSVAQHYNRWRHHKRWSELLLSADGTLLKSNTDKTLSLAPSVRTPA